MNDIKTTTDILNTKEVERNTNSIVSNFNKIQKGIESNTNALQELQKVLVAYQESLNGSDSKEIPGLDQVKKIILVMDTLQTITSKFQNVGRGKMFPLNHCHCFENADNNMCSLGY